MPQFSLFSVLGISALVVSAGGALALGALQVADAERSCETPYQSGSTSNLVTMSQGAAGEPVVSFPTPLITPERQVTIVQEGEGEPARAGGYVDFDVSVFVGSDQMYLTGSSYDPSNPVRRAVNPEGPDFFAQIMECQKPGAQIVVTAELADIFGPIDEDDYLQNSSTVVAVIDVRDTFPGLAEGSARLPESGMPTITQAPTGHHGFTFPNAPIPEGLRVSVLKMGEGEPIRQGDFVTSHFTGVVWNTRQIFISSFDQGVPLGLIADDQTTSATGEGVVPGLAQALIGKTVGSQVLVSVPPELGYRTENLPPGVSPNSTLVFVFDILGVSN
jgi:hypothetical protein